MIPTLLSSLVNNKLKNLTWSCDRKMQGISVNKELQLRKHETTRSNPKLFFRICVQEKQTLRITQY